MHVVLEDGSCGYIFQLFKTHKFFAKLYVCKYATVLLAIQYAHMAFLDVIDQTKAKKIVLFWLLLVSKDVGSFYLLISMEKVHYGLVQTFNIGRLLLVIPY